ncbi:MAG: hypothetical protein ACRENI_02380 [Gemmatimonadaceae bacterium]
MLTLLAGTLLASACGPAPVEWEEPEVVASQNLADQRLLLDATGAARLVSNSDALEYQPAGACPRSVRVARGREGVAYAVWWAPRGDSSAALLAARSTDSGRHWGAHVPVDTVDRAAAGCERPPPSIAVDTSTGYVHVAYFLVAPEGAGIFFAHSMDRGGLYHQPLAIVYGDRPAATAIAADRSVVGIAYEEPNSRRPRIGIALSATDGHIFQHRLSPVSAPSAVAYDPRVALRDDAIAVAWTARTGRGGGVAAGDAVTVVRVGSARLRGQP